MATKKFSELTSVDPSADLTKTYIPVYDEVSSTTRKISLQQINDAVELTIPFAQASFNVANTATTSAATADQKAVAAGLYANSAFARANNSLNVSTGGTITGDITLTGNLSITGCTASLIVSTLRTSDPVIDLSYGVSGSPTQNAGVRILRGDEPSTQLRWNETSNKWEFTNDGSSYYGIAADWIESFSANSYIHANAAFATANTLGAGDQYARGHANSSYIHANASYIASNTANAYTITINNLLNTTIANITGYSIKTNSVYDVANSTSINVSIVSSYTNSAYTLANTANNVAYTAQDIATSAGRYANASYGVANSASSYANGAFTRANTGVTSASVADQRAVTAGSYANASYTLSNTVSSNATSASSYANGAFSVANNVTAAASYANGAFIAANTAQTRAIQSGDYANSAFVSANTSEGALILYDTRITVGSDYANSAFIAANVAGQRAVTSGSYANSAFAAANNISTTTFLANTSGTFAGDLNVQGKITLKNGVSIEYEPSASPATFLISTVTPLTINVNTDLYTFSTNGLTVPGKLYTEKLIYTGNTTVTQTTSRSNGVTLNSSFGDVVLYASAMSALAVDAIAVTNNKAVAGDMVVCSVLGNPGTYIAGGYCSTDGLVVLWIKNITSSSTSSEQPIIKFALIQPVTSV